MQPRCSICWTMQDLAKCSKEDCPNLLCTRHANLYDGRSEDCWDTVVWTPNLRHLKIETHCSERRFGWQQHVFSDQT